MRMWSWHRHTLEETRGYRHAIKEQLHGSFTQSGSIEHSDVSNCDPFIHQDCNKYFVTSFCLYERVSHRYVFEMSLWFHVAAFSGILEHQLLVSDSLNNDLVFVLEEGEKDLDIPSLWIWYVCNCHYDKLTLALIPMLVYIISECWGGVLYMTCSCKYFIW